MTPLAANILKQCLSVSRRDFPELAAIRDQIRDIHCFERSSVDDLVEDLASKFEADAARGSFDGTLAFLPAEKTWIEVNRRQQLQTMLQNSELTDNEENVSSSSLITGRSAWLLVQDGDRAHITGFAERSDGGFAEGYRGDILLHTDRPILLSPTNLDVRTGLPNSFLKKTLSFITFEIYAALALINSPRIIGRVQHMPHRGLEKRLRGERQIIGHFPLNAWTEIKLEVSPPKDLSDAGEFEAHLTGRKALHFCRAHLRIRYGQLEFVRAHWRGDPTLGTKRSRYILTPPHELRDPS